MIDHADAIYSGLYSVLDGVSYDGTEWSVYTSVPKSVFYNYVLLDTIDQTDAKTKDTPIVAHSILITVVSGGFNSRINKRPANDISSQILTRVIKKEIQLSGLSWAVTPQLELIDDDEDITDDSLVYRKFIRLTCKTEER